jgi:hypothetical protein
MSDPSPLKLGLFVASVLVLIAIPTELALRAQAVYRWITRKEAPA